MPSVVNYGADITVRVDGTKYRIPPGESEQPEEVLQQPLCVALINERTPTMKPKGDDPNGEMVQMKDYRLVVDGRTPARQVPKVLDEDGEVVEASDRVPAIWQKRLDDSEEPKTDKESAWRETQIVE